MNAVPFWVPTNTHIPLSFLCHQLATPIPFSPQTSTSFLNLHLHFSSLLSSSFHLLPIIYLHKHTYIYIYIYIYILSATRNPSGLSSARPLLDAVAFAKVRSNDHHTSPKFFQYTSFSIQVGLLGF